MLLRQFKHNVFTVEINQIALSSNDDQKCYQLIQYKHMKMQQAKI